jgi:fucose permease
VDGDPRGSADTRSAHSEGGRVIDAMRHPTFPWIAATLFLFSLGVGIPVHFVAFLRDQGYPIAFAAGAAGGIGASQVLGRIVFTPLERSLAPRAVSVLVYGLAPLALLILLLVPSAAGVLAFVIVYGASRGMDTLVRTAIVADQYGTRRFATISSVLILLTTVSGAIAPIALGALYDRLGSYLVGLWALCGLHALAAVTVYFGDRRTRRHAHRGVEPASDIVERA